MSALHFRVLVVAVMLFCVFGGTIDLLFPNHLANSISDYAKTLQPEMEINALSIIVVLTASICMIGSFIGLLMFKPWGRLLFLLGFISSLPLYFLSGPDIYSPLGQMFYDIGAYGKGFILALCYFSPISLRFEKAAH